MYLSPILHEFLPFPLQVGLLSMRHMLHRTCSGAGKQRTAVSLALVLSVHSACAMDEEAAVRTQLNNWVVLEETHYFNSKRDCTAGFFATGATQVLSGASKVRTSAQGLRQLGQGRAVAFDVAETSSADTQEEIDQLDHFVGLAILASGLAARTCFTPELESAFAETLSSDGAVLIYDPRNHALALFDGARKRVFYTRGEL